MNRQHFLFQSVAILVSLCSISTVAIAEPLPAAVATSSVSEIKRSIALPSPSIESIANFGEGMSRCKGKIFLNRASQNYFSALLPADYVAETASTGATNLWFYIPENRMAKAEFSLGANDDASGAIMHFQELNNVDGKNGLLKITIPPNTIRPNTSYWWDLALVLDDVDRSADVYMFGSINQQSLEQVSLDKSPAALALLTDVLSNPTSILSLDESKAQALATALQTSLDSETISMAESQLREYFISRHDDYGQLTQVIAELAQDSRTNAAELEEFEQKHSQMLLELAQVSAFFELWGDTANYLAMARATHPEEWQSLLEVLFLEKQGADAEGMISVLTTAQDF
ncbi:hypothetical protein Lepto7376_1245 [[Leptolyngbya] sp. PCC 7376]|uniref:DUF928 domain-containing protein n=1 Tax=[Leptolyngbya] sp. PCC 7376 TaxID=111781 RepID=UPI00029F08E8|nr:DUF928 domain-containing protein [[Leptolyngbya] sp. PCC 7376]AFY37600.1 hypothetical protein Lepto7376_1245 [[Leptolyngbya] sp. PCC 7376]